MTAPTGVLLMTFGSAQTADEVPAYLRSVRGGGDPDPAVVAEFQRRYELVGWSPLVRITLEQGEALQRALDESHGPGRFAVAVGMLHSDPRIDEAVRSLARAGAGRLIGIVLSPQYSPIIMGGYDRALAAAAGRELPGVEIRVAGPWHTAPSFVDELAGRVRQALERFPEPDRVPIIFTAHSLPRAVVDRDLDYIDQLVETIELVAARAGLAPERWQFAYQSAGHTPEEWLKPDLKDLLPGLRDAGHEDVLVVPVQFLADHLEILYDIDVAAREEAEEAGLRFHRIDLPNTSPVFIRALAEVVEREEGAVSASTT
ncbi:MAG TPA: ferrochelatase [Candidatus Eisenbacteria bacterium]|nr:ferrochelatase [Candidatus Eisenbacteria bacterium]